MAEQSINYHISPENTKENRLSPDKIIEKSYKTKDNIVESDLNAVNEIQKKLKDALDSINQLTLKLKSVEDNNICMVTNNEKLTKKVEMLETTNACLKTNNEELTKKMEMLETTSACLKASNEELISTMEKMKSDNYEIKRKITELEVLIVRNNINIDLLANRDTLKSLLLILSINLGYSTINDIVKESNILKYREKFSNLVLKVLSKLSSHIQVPFTRAGITPILSDIETFKKYIIFVECIEFIVLSIDNIIHPPHDDDQSDEDVFSKLIGKRNIASLDEGLIHFFKNPKNMEELVQITKNEKNQINEVNFENYDSAKNNAYLINKSYYNELKGNNYNKGFYIQYLFDPGKDNFSQVKMNLDYENFKSQMMKTINHFNEKKIIYGYDAEFLIANLKWFS